jgi:hypothetical protein
VVRRPKLVKNYSGQVDPRLSQLLGSAEGKHMMVTDFQAVRQ